MFLLLCSSGVNFLFDLEHILLANIFFQYAEFLNDLRALLGVRNTLANKKHIYFTPYECNKRFFNGLQFTFNKIFLTKFR